MLEKIGLPPKPSLRGNAWVVDSSHCQSCSSPFTFINRKHHCRRCGGLFCNSCTQQRMVLRGQGDSPVRICDPCKKLEEAARFEMRYGHKNRAGKGGSKLASEEEQDVLNQILGNEDKTMGSASSSSIRHMTTNAGDNTERNLSIDRSADASTYSESLTPDDLRQQAVLEKQKYKTLKTEGKSEEALRAFKRGKELERQAAALEISLRKSRKKASSSSNFDDLQQVKDDFKASAEKVKLPTQKGKEGHDLSSQLKELGWSDADLRDAEKRPATLTLEGELSSLLGEVSQKPEKKHMSTSDRSQVIAHKKKALELKRAGNLLEAKEELKRAKILERKIEEEELLGGADDSDDELSSLIRSMDAEGNDKYSSVNTIDANFDISKFVGTGDDLGGDGAFDVTDDDLEDPDMISALKSLGWNEDAVHAVDNVTNFKVTHDTGHKPSPKNKLSIQRELIALKKNVLNLRRGGKIDESEAELEKAKILEQQLEDMNKASTVAQQSTETYATITSTALSKEDEEEVTDNDLQDPTYLLLLENLGWKDESNDNNSTSTSTTMKEKASRILPSMLQGNVVPSNDSSNSVAPQSAVIVESVTYRKSKGEIQRELLTLKRKALTLRRQGNTEEADEILENAKVLEAQLQEYEDAPQRKVPSESGAGNILIDADSQQKNNKSSPGVDLIGNGTFQSVDQSKNRLDKHEPVVNEHDKSNVQEPFLSQAIIAEPQPMSVQQEILAHKRKALALKREGKLAEAKEELRLAKILEKHEEDTSQASQSTINSIEESVPKEPIPEKKEASPSVVSKPKSSHDRFKLQQESLRHKRQALKLRREGKTEEADAEFELAKALETQLQELDDHDSARSSQSDVEAGDVRVEDFLDPQLRAALQSVGMEDVRSKSQPIVIESPPSSGKSIGGNMDTSKSEVKQLEEQIKGEKVKAVNLKRAGRQAEALDALRRAKLYEKKLQSLTSK